MKTFFENLSGSARAMILLVAVVIFTLPLAQAAWFNNLPYTVTQPDGTEIHCFVSGDEFYNWLHDENGYTIIAGADGFYYYGVLVNDEVTASAYRVDQVLPESTSLTPWAMISEKKYKQIREEFDLITPKGVTAPHDGEMNSLVVYIRFSDQTEFTVPRSVYDAKFNEPNGISQKNYFWEVSYQNLWIESHHYPVCELTTNLSYQDVHPRAYYEPYHAVNNPIGYQNNTQRTNREHILLANAIAFIAPEVPLDLIIDADNDGLVDNVCFIIRGGNGAWASLLWAHRWVLYSQNVYIHGKRVWDYTFQPESQNDVYTLCHEMFHVLSAPDLYHYTGNGISPAGPWDLMESGFVHMGAYMKWKYANQVWIPEIPEITAAGTYTLNPLTSPENNAFKIASPNSNVEFFVVEYRKKEGLYESNIPGSGLLVYRIDPSAGNGNASGPPDEVYIYRPNGTVTSNGSVNQAHFSANVNRTFINDDSNPSSFLQYGAPGGLNIFNITASEETISFDILLGVEVTASFSANQTTVPANGSVTFSDQSGNIPTSWEWFFDGGTPAYSTQQNPTVMYTNNGIYNVMMIASNEYSSDTILKENYIIVGTPVAGTNPASFNVTLPVNASSTHSLLLANSGDTWLRFYVDYEYAGGSSSSGNSGDILGTYENLTGSRAGMAWANGLLYVLHMNSSVMSVYDTVSQSITATYSLHNSPFGLAWDGSHLWIGSNDGLLRSYTTTGEFTGSAISIPLTGIHGLAWDGQCFLVNPVNLSNPTFLKIDTDGNILEEIISNVGSRILQLHWVQAHLGGSLWANMNGKIARLKLVENKYVIAEEFSGPANVSYSLAHDGTDLWWTGSTGSLFRIEDGYKEWMVAYWFEPLLAQGLQIEIPVFFNAKGMEEGQYHGTVYLDTNDPLQGVIEIPVLLNVSGTVGLHETELTASSILVRDGIISIYPSSKLHFAEVYDLSGRKLRSVHHQSEGMLQITGLQNTGLLLLRLVEENGISSHKVILF